MALRLLMANGNDAFSKAHALEISPSFARNELFFSAAPGVVRSNIWDVPLRVGAPFSDFGCGYQSTETLQVWTDLVLDTFGEVDCQCSANDLRQR